MNSKLNTLLRFGISVGLQDRDAFVTKVSNLLQEKMGTNEIDAQKIGEKVLNAMEAFKDELVIDRIVSGTTKGTDKIEEQIAELRKSIEDLEKKIEKNAE